MRKREIAAIIVVILFYTLACTSAWASDDSVPGDILSQKIVTELPSSSLKTYSKIPVTPTELYERTQAVLNYFQVPAEASNDDLISLYSGIQPASEIKRIISILDFDKQFIRFTKNGETHLDFFNDRDGYSETDVTLDYSAATKPSLMTEAIQHLIQAKKNPADRPLLGLRIALDPGHMSTKAWDLRTGKYVHDKSGRTISEGLINLQTCLLLKAEFEKLGAIVKLTREDHNEISEVSYEALELKPYALRALRQGSLNDWFINLVSTSSGAELNKKFEQDPNVKNIFSEKARSHYFILGADLDARVESIEEFNPDISLVIHYDSHDPANDPNGVNSKRYSRVKTYVHGKIDPTEWSRKEDRRFIIHKLFDSNSWNASFGLANKVVGGLKKNLGLDFDKGGGGSSVAVAPGVFARNLFITRKLHGHAHAYVECLHYNDPGEFKSMLKKDFPLVIQGQTTYYSKRLKQVVDGIRNGVLDFTKSYSI